METVLRGVAIYFFLLIVLRLAGRRSLGELTSFDFVLLLIVAETTQQALPEGWINGKTWIDNSGIMNGGSPRPAMTWLMNQLGRPVP